MPLSLFEQQIRELVDLGMHSHRQLSDADRTELAIAYYAIDHARTDVSEILASDPDVDEMFARAKAGELAELGMLVVRAMHSSTRQAVDTAFEAEERRRREERECAEEDRRWA